MAYPAVGMVLTVTMQRVRAEQRAPVGRGAHLVFCAMTYCASVTMAGQ